MSLAILVLAAGCKTRPPEVPGETDVKVAAVEILPMKEGEELALEHEPLFERLGERPGSLINTDRYWSPFREAEDRRRIEAFWQQRGYFDVEVSPAETKMEDGEAHVTFKVRENQRYAMESGVVHAAPPSHAEALEELVPFHAGDTEGIDLEAYRKARHDMEDVLRRAGFGHAVVYDRIYVDRPAKKIHFHYFVDAGPKTKIASIAVDGAVKIPKEDVLRRSGLEVGEPYTEDLRDRVVRDLLDTGAYSAAFVRIDTDTKYIVPGTAPDSGGELRDDQIDADGNLVPRQLPEGVNLTIHVVEAPTVTIRLKAGFEIDPARADTFLDGTLWLRNLMGPMQHLALSGTIGYGWLFGTPSDSPSGLWGEVTIRTIHAGALGRLGDLRTTSRYRGTLHPSAYLHELDTGPGLRTTIAKGAFFDFDLFAHWERALGFGPFSAAEREDLRLQDQRDAYGPELHSQIVWDARDSAIEAMRGHLLSLEARFSPGDPIATNRFLELAPDASLHIPFGTKLSLALRASGAWIFLNDDAGVPLSARLFGGGAYGNRGYGRELFSPHVARCFEAYCTEVPVGGLSLLETSAEFRFLPPQKPIGAVAFVDFGGASADDNPFARGPSFAAGAGARLRIWYLPASIDVAWLVLDAGRIQGVDDAPLHVFFRIGEAF
ncbi:MAG TPA: BamA/TamA family outer membrane protein [Polyangiaceae bacterium]|nr:BamA/TamA family outer membrane protein [Polyangiaceae bacterium]